jgi:transcription initiation factor TFIIF subunit alpha
LSEINSASPNATAMSDGEATAGEMSDNGRKKKIKLRIGTSPTGSRAGSPAPGRSGSATGSRAGSPQITGMSFYLEEYNLLINSDSARPAAPLGPITAAEIRTAMPPGGITLSELLKIFGRRVGDAAQGKMDKKQFIILVKQNTRMDANKRLYAK